LLIHDAIKSAADAIARHRPTGNGLRFTGHTIAASKKQMAGYVFTTNWFEKERPAWEELFTKVKPRKILEIGSYEGASAVFLIETLAKDFDIELHCIDTWAGSLEHRSGGLDPSDMGSVELHFQQNTAMAIREAKNRVDLKIHKELSELCLPRLLAMGSKNYFDFIYIDGSHQAPDVLYDAVLAFKLLSVGGLMILDDYLWNEPLPTGKDPLRSPKLAIDAFVNINLRKLNVLSTLNSQVFIQKISD
jgi:predicted O-methyltransferase YrrM